MNIFAVDENPFKAAEMLCDKHVVKMILESCQLLSTWIYLKHPDKYDSSKFYRPTHINHPCTKWLLESDANVWWLYRHCYSLINEYSIRYKKTHSCRYIYANFVDVVNYHMNREKMTPFKQCMPEQYKVPGNAIQAYRNYMIGEKTRFAKWKLGNKPGWWS